MWASADKSGQGGADRALPVAAYRFAEFRLLASQQRLEARGQPVALTTKLYHLLLTLARNPGEVLDKESIVEAVWPGQVVTDAALAKQMQRLRALLDDGSRDPPLIETHRGRGYRLTCTVDVETTPDEPVSLPTTGATSPRRRSILGVALAAVTLIVAALALVALQPDGTAPQDRPIALVPVGQSTSGLSEGAVEYFANRFGTATEVAPILPSDEPPQRATELGSLDIYQRRGGPVATVQLGRDGDSYELWISLRGDDVVATARLTDASVHQLLDRGSQWVEAQAGIRRVADPDSNPFALSSYFEALATDNCEQASPYLRAAIASDPALHWARLRLGRCDLLQGNAQRAAATATALLVLAEQTSNPMLALDARLLAARAHFHLGNTDAARAELSAATALAGDAVSPLHRLSTLAAIADLAKLNGTADEALTAHQQRLVIAESEYPLPRQLAQIQLDIAGAGIAAGDYALVREHAERARELVEEHGDANGLLRAYRFLITSYYRSNDLDAAVQLALAARPLLDNSDAKADKAYFMQFAALALNLRGLLVESREYTARLRALETTTANPMYGVIADLTVNHRLYVQRDYVRAHRFAASTRARLQAQDSAHSALPLALAFEALAAARGAEPATARGLIAELEREHVDDPTLVAERKRAEGHLLARLGEAAHGVALLRDSEALYRELGVTSVANYVAYELIEMRLQHEAAPPWDDLERMIARTAMDYQLARVLGLAHAKDDNSIAATAALAEAKLLGNALWSTEDEVLLEQQQTQLARADIAMDEDP